MLGKTVSKSRRGVLMGWSAGLSGIAVLAVGLGLGGAGRAAGGLLWIPATFLFASIREQPGATAGGGNALRVALAQVRPVIEDPPFRRYLIARAFLLSVCGWAARSTWSTWRAKRHAPPMSPSPIR